MYLWTDAFATGRWDEAQQLADDCLAACLASGGAVYAQIAKYHLAILAGVHGDQETVDALAGELADWATSHGTRQTHTFAWHAKALAATGRGDFETAYQNAAAISPAGTFAPYEPLALWACPDLVEGAVATGRGAAARAHADAMNRHRLADISPRLALIAGGCAATAAEDDHEAARLFDRALSVPAADRWVFDYARVQLAYAQRLRRIHGSRESRHHLLRAALATFDTIGARPWADRAARELRAVGPGRTSPAGGDVTGPGALTQHELKVGWRQINRAGHPMMWPIFWPDDTDFSNPANTRHPSKDTSDDGEHIASLVAAVAAASATLGDPRGYGQAVAAELLPDLLPYVIGTPATYGFAVRNGRPLADNAPEVMLTLVTGTAIPSGLKPAVTGHLRTAGFPYVLPGQRAR